jgi:hypothetical protein
MKARPPLIQKQFGVQDEYLIKQGGNHFNTPM